MADSVVSDGIGEALLDLVRQAAAGAPRQIQRAVEWLRENAEPPAGIKLISPDGTAFTGIAILDHSKVIVLLAVRHHPQSRMGADRAVWRPSL